MKRFLIFLIAILLGTSTGFTQTSWNMPTTGTDTIRTCSGFIYDSGGPDGNYSLSELSTMIIYPAEGNSGTFTISGVYELANYGGATLTIYDGVGFTPITTPLGRYSGTGNIPVLTSTTGAFTISFKSSSWADPLSGFKLNVSCINCFSAATHLNSSNITLTSANISWNTNGIIPQSWQYVYGPEGSNPVLLTPVSITDSSVTLTDLQHSSAYDVWVRAVCGPNDYSLWSPLFSFRTLCGDISTLPYIESFDSYDYVRIAVPGVFPFPPCWHKNVSAIPGYPALVNSGYVSSPASLKFSLSPTGMRTSYVTTPPIDTSAISMDEIKVNFEIQPNSNMPVQIGVMNDPADTSTFTLVQTFTPSTTMEWQSVEVPFNRYTGTGRYLAIKMELNSNNSAEVLIDNFKISPVSNCMAPSELFVSNITPFTAQFSWTPNNNETSWEISLVEPGYYPDEEGVLSIQSNPYTLTNLNPDSKYAVYIRAICGEESTSDWVATPFVFSTTCPVYEAPFTENFNDFESGTPPCWKQYTGLASQIFNHLTTLAPIQYGPWSLIDEGGLPTKH
ncbi:MAG: fibronectin type III domain-containing protein, partial [Bacteroidales bacterium]